MNENLSDELKNISCADVCRFVLNAPAKTSNWKKISAIRLTDGNFQVEKLTEKQAFHEKITETEKLFDHEIFSLFGKDFLQLEICDDEFSYSFRAAKKRILFNRKKLKSPALPVQKTQNREKKLYP